MTDAQYSRLAAEHLPGDLGRRWTALLRPCHRLRRAMDGERTVAVLGGNPELPAGIGWPEWPGHGPLSFIASVRCAALPRGGLAEEFPRKGILLFFFFDGQVDEDVLVSADDPETRAGAQVLYVPEDTPVFPTQAPPELEAFSRVELTADTEQSAPDLWLPQARQALLGDSRPWPHPRETPAELKSFLRAFGRLRTRIGHQVGGHALPVQGPVEYDIANAALDGMHAWGDRPLDQEAERWILLAQFDSDGDAKMAWGEEGALYWLIRPDDLAALRFDQARFTVQG
ncbi:YwqG family protein [Streptomyces sp. NBC_00582]|uniref:YwqG family protein n=1 Tax=Streptomyces sp. NBC_00582 TaxID=2975783 RepID=UPI002E7FF4A2|nr:YwqG family protein [Streptomyces sp. NBC_00582]WUB67171.1 YwqG family protein [Streptomyces sp. NBC_00582]